MVLNTEEFKNACSKILKAMDNTSTSNFVGRVELLSENGTLFMNVTNGEYFVEISLGNYSEPFHATVSADLFLKLASQLTTDTVEFSTNDTTLLVKANGKYKLPLIYDNNEILHLPKIIINNPTVNFTIDGAILNSILINNSKELSKIPKDSRVSVNQVQRMYYVDNEGAITFYNGACVNKFTLEKPVKMLLNGNLVKLFSLFKGCSVDFTLGYDAITEEIIQTKICLKSDGICITAILSCDDTLLRQMPATAIRARAFNDYPYVVTADRAALLSAIHRMTLFTSEAIVSNYKTCGKFKFTSDSVTMTDYSAENVETIKYANQLPNAVDYDTLLDLNDIKLALESNDDEYISISFGDGQAMVIAKDNVYTVIPEIIQAD